MPEEPTPVESTPPTFSSDPGPASDVAPPLATPPEPEPAPVRPKFDQSKPYTMVSTSDGNMKETTVKQGDQTYTYIEAFGR